MSRTPRPHISRIVSGGQTGVDRAALDAAIALGIDHGGHCPRGRRAEDGRIPDRYHLEETQSSRYEERTEKNVVGSDATVIFSRGPATGGTLLTARLARRHGRPLLHLDLEVNPEPIEAFRRFCREHDVHCLNVAGPRASGAPGLGTEVERLLRWMLGPTEGPLASAGSSL